MVITDGTTCELEQDTQSHLVSIPSVDLGFQALHLITGSLAFPRLVSICEMWAVMGLASEVYGQGWVNKYPLEPAVVGSGLRKLASRRQNRNQQDRAPA